MCVRECVRKCVLCVCVSVYVWLCVCGGTLCQFASLYLCLCFYPPHPPPPPPHSLMVVESMVVLLLPTWTELFKLSVETEPPAKDDKPRTMSRLKCVALKLACSPLCVSVCVCVCVCLSIFMSLSLCCRCFSRLLPPAPPSIRRLESQDQREQKARDDAASEAADK